MSEVERLSLAEGLLQEVVFRSRARQAAGTGLEGARLDQPVGPGSCGLGDGAALELDLSTEARALFQRLWPTPPGPEELGRIRGVLDRWVGRQDALDRKRNHFLRDFRARHGTDRRAYSPAVLAEYEAGLAAINGEVEELRREAARELAP